MILETPDNLDFKTVNKIKDWFNKNIGTDYEINESASGNPNEYYFIGFDMLESEFHTFRLYLINRGVL